MLDIETLGTAPGCVVTEIAIVQFDIKTFSPGGSFNHVFDVLQQIQAGLSVNTKTLGWRIENAPVDFSRKSLIGRNDIEAFLGAYGPKSERMMWCRGASFDYPIVKYMMSALGIEVPWEYRNENCLRTFINAHRDFVKDYEAGAERLHQHNAYFDCLHQIGLLEALFLRNRNENFEY